MKNSCRVSAAIAAFLLLLGTQTVAQNQCRPELPVPGTWMAGTGQASTIAGAGGAAQTIQGRLDVEECGAAVLFSGPGVPYSPVVFTQVGPNTFFNQDPNHAASTITGQFVDQKNFQGVWSFTATATSDFFMSHLSTDATEPDDATLTSAVCSCPGFKEELQLWVEEAEEVRDLYKDPRFSVDPKSEFAKWEMAAVEALIDRYMNTDAFINGNTSPAAVKSAYATALKEAKAHIASLGRGGTSGSQTQASGGNPSRTPSKHVSSSNAAAETDIHTCKPTYLDSPDQCYPALHEAMSMSHEQVHVKACLAQNELNETTSSNLERTTLATSRYSIRALEDVQWSVDEEVRAYNAGIKWLRDWYAAQCGGSL
ncbi:MAG: hypothetical protein AAF679_12110 [Pseudomonadota bacterium]